MSITINLPDDLADQLNRYKDELPQILELGLREWKSRMDQGFAGLSSVLEILAGLPAPEEVLALRPAPAVQAHLEKLLEKSRTTGLTADEQRDWDRFQFVEHLVRLAKAQALRKLKSQ